MCICDEECGFVVVKTLCLSPLCNVDVAEVLNLFDAIELVHRAVLTNLLALTNPVGVEPTTTNTTTSRRAIEAPYKLLFEIFFALTLYKY